MGGATSVFSNPAGSAREAGARYTAAVLELLGDREPLEVMDELVFALEALVARAGDRLGVPEAPGKWSVAQVLWHLADAEMVQRYRLRVIVAQPGAPITGYDQDAWASGLRYADADPREALELLRVLRPATVRWARTLGSDELAREGVHEERGPESVAHVLRMTAGHDLLHRRQIQRILDAVGA